MDTFNVFAANEGGWDQENDRDGYRHKVTAIGNRLGASLLGGSLYELAPGEATWPYHYELGCEEWLLVVAGQPTLRGARRRAAARRRVTSSVFPAGPTERTRSTTARPTPSAS